MQSMPDKPIVFWDTCALLDLLRINRKPDDSLIIYRNILAIIEKIESGNILSVVVKELINVEIANNKSNIIKEYQTDLRKLNKSIEDHHKLMQEVLPIPTANNIIQLRDIHAKFEDIIDNIISKSYNISRNSAVNQRAEKRVLEYKYPSKNGQIKDSWMIESCIEMRKHQISFLNPCIFVSSNTGDFFDNSNDKLFHRDIKTDTEPLNIVYRKNIVELYGYLIGKSII